MIKIKEIEITGTKSVLLFLIVCMLAFFLWLLTSLWAGKILVIPDNKQTPPSIEEIEPSLNQEPANPPAPKSKNSGKTRPKHAT